MGKMFVLEMVDGHVKNADLVELIQISQQYKRNSKFENFVKINRKQLRLSVRIFKKKIVHLFSYIANSASKKKLAIMYKGNKRSIIRTHKYLFFWLIYIKFGESSISMAFINTYINSISKKKYGICSTDSGDGEKLIFLLLIGMKIFVVKFEGISKSTTNSSTRSSEGSSAIVHEALMYGEIQKIIPDDTICCSYYGKFNNTNGIFNLLGDATFENVNLHFSKTQDRCLRQKLKYSIQNSNEEFYFLVTNLIPGFTTYFSQLPYLQTGTLQKIFVNLMRMLFELHGHRIFHSDLHLNNILCDVNGNVKLFDYDLSSCLPNLDARILIDYEFNYKCIRKTLQHFEINITDDKILQYMDYYYVMFIIDMSKYISSHDLDSLNFFKNKDIYTRSKISENMLQHYCYAKKKKISEFTRRALLAVMIFHEPSEYSGNGDTHTISSSDESDGSDREDSETDAQSIGSTESFDTCSNTSQAS